MDDPFSRERVQSAYDRTADAYEAAFGEDLSKLPIDRQMLDHARASAHEGLILDLGCGTGSAGRYLAAHGARVVGLDLSIGMLKAGTGTQPFDRCQGDMRELPFTAGSFAVVVAYYSIQHVPRAQLGVVLAEVTRVLEPDGAFLLATHLGEGEVFSTQLLGQEIEPTGGCLYSASEMSGHLASTRFVIERTETRGPLQHEHQTQRAYLFARMVQ